MNINKFQNKGTQEFVKTVEKLPKLLFILFYKFQRRDACV